MDLTWYPMPQQQQLPGYGGGVGGNNAPGNEAGAGGGSGAGGGTGGGEGGGEGGAGDNYGYDPADNPGRGVNPGRGYDGPGKFDTPGGRGRDPGWDKPGGYDYGPNGDVVAKVDPVTGRPTFRLFGQAAQDHMDAQLADMRETNPIAGAIATAMSRMPMGQLGQLMSRTFGIEVDYEGNVLGREGLEGEGGSEEALNRIEEQARKEAEGKKDDKDEDGPKTSAADEAYKDLLARLRRGRGTTDWQEPDYSWIYRLSGLTPPEETT